MKVGIIGAGTMGQGIAKAFAQVDGYEVALCDIKQEWADGGKEKIKKGYARLAGGELSYKLYSYRSGYVLETSLFQTKAKGLSYIFKNPYKAGLEMIAHFDKDNLLTDEKSFAVTKERLVSKKNFTSSALSSLLGNIHADYSSPVFDEKKVKDVKIEEVLSLLDAFLNSDTGDYFYLGEEEKKDPF